MLELFSSHLDKDSEPFMIHYGEELYKHNNLKTAMEHIRKIELSQQEYEENMRKITLSEMEYKHTPPPPQKPTHNFRVDQIVKVVNTTFEPMYAHLYIKDLDKYIGLNGKISEIKNDIITIQIKLQNVNEWSKYNFPASSLEDIKSNYLEEHKNSILKKGDLVQITRAAYSYENGWDCNWITSMNENIGKLGMIVEDEKNAGFSVKVFTNGEVKKYPYFILQKIEIDDYKMVDYNPYLAAESVAKVEREKIYNKLLKLGIFDKDKLYKIVFE